MPKRFWSLDLLRFFAATLVMVFHLSWWSWVEPKSTPASVLQGAASFPAWEPFAWFGWVGVEIFFVISGFVIFYSAQGATALSFLRRRFLRLFPAALICATITALTLYGLNLYGAVEIATRYLRSVFFWPFGPWVDGVYWTLAIEVAFYSLVFACLLCGQKRHIEAVVIAIGTISSALWFLDLATNDKLTGNLIGMVSGRIESLLLFQHGMLFALGSLIYAGTTSRWTIHRVGFSVIFFVSGCFPIILEANEKVARFDLTYSTAIPVLVWATSVAVIIISAHFESALKPRVMSKISIVGRSTYPLYLLHDVVGAATMLGLIAIGLASTAALIASMLAMAVLSLVVCTMLEDRLRYAIDPRRFTVSFPQEASGPPHG